MYKYKEETSRTTLRVKEGVDEMWKELKEVVNKYTNKKQIKIVTTPNEQRWWDHDCRLKRRELNKKLRQAKKQLIDKAEYRKCNKEYEELCRRKKEIYNQKWIEEVSQISREADTWKYIKRFRGKRETISEEISIEDWQRHFMVLLQGSEERKRNRIENNQTCDTQLTDEEIEVQMKKMKKIKAAGQDGVKNEAWMYSQGEVRERLKEIIKKVYRGEGFPEEWRTSIIHPIWKKGCKDETENTEDFHC